MIKLLSNAWLAAEHENKSIRDNKRAAFWSELAVRKAVSLEEMEIAPIDRLENVLGLLENTLGKAEDAGVAGIINTMAAELTSIAPGSLQVAMTLPLRMQDLTVFQRGQFFQTELIPDFTFKRID